MLITLHSVILTCVQHIRALPSGRQVDVLRVGLMLGTLSSTNMPQPPLAAVVLGAVNKLMHLTARRALNNQSFHYSAHPAFFWSLTTFRFLFLSFGSRSNGQKISHPQCCTYTTAHFFPCFAHLPSHLCNLRSLDWRDICIGYNNVRIT